ncbi:MAG: putative inorganic carbon transporter subunit DabA, partial [Pseudomonadota bacterium]
MMNTELSRHEHAAMNAQAQDIEALRETALGACRLIAPLWPLKSFVAVNPMMGFTDQSFEASASALAERAGATLLMERGYYRMMLEAGAYTREHISEAMLRLGRTGPMTTDNIIDALHRPQPVKAAIIATAADAAGDIDGNDWGQLVVDQLSFWAAGHFDEGEARQKNPWKGMPAYAAWREQAMIDRTPELMGLKGFRRQTSALPEQPLALLAQVARELQLTNAALKPYFHRLLTTVAGWAGHARFRGWAGELGGGEPEGVIDILAIRAAYDLLIAKALQSDEFAQRWSEAKASYMRPAHEAFDAPSLIAQTAMEVALQERVVAGLAENRGKKTFVDTRPAAQLVFCIDVRSERIRR